MMFREFLRKYNLTMVLSLLFLPIASIVGIPLYIYYNGIVWQEPVMFLLFWFLAGTGITIGYHRLFAHKSFKTYPFIEWVVMLCGSMALQNSISKWCSDHRRHHRKLDTDEDPYSITEGFFHAHIGWILKNSDSVVEHVSDLQKKSAVKFQDKHYWKISLFLSFVLPVLIGFLYGRPIGGLLWGGILRVTMVHHFTFFINSLCHYIGKKEYDLNTSAKDSWFMALFTFGEGYHNYHHKFEWDYRNGIKWYNFDPSKWVIKSLSVFNLAHSLRKASDYNIFKAKIDTLNNKINKLYVNIDSEYYKNRVSDIMDRAMVSLSKLKELEMQYRVLGRKDSRRYEYKQQIKAYKIDLQKSLSALMVVFANIRAAIQ